MTPPRVLLLTVALAAGATTLTAAEISGGAEELFTRRVAPLLREKCLACHGQDETKLKGGLDLRTRAEALLGGDSGTPAVIAGRPDESPLYLSARRDHGDWEAMPPKESEALTSDQLDWLREWIAGGAPWPDAARQDEIRRARGAAWAAEDGVTVTTSPGLSPEWNGRRYQPADLWAFQPLRKPAVPAGPAHPVDAFVEEKLSALGLAPAPAAEARVLLRRLSFGLTGLPPSPEEVVAFAPAHAADPRAAVASAVDRLLASPHHGERMAQHWLDVVRYADTAGFANDYERGNAWRYRDYVVRAFNADRPYDRFIREQIAGDERDPGNPEAVVATGFLRMGPWELTGMEVAKVARQRFLDDVTNSVGETFLAQPLQCARCHDHKFDPIPTRDYYAVQAVFATTQLAERPAAFLPEENRAGFAERKYLEQRRADHLAALQRLDERMLANAAEWFRAEGRDPARWDAAVAQARTQERAKQRREFEGVFAAARSILLRQKVAEDTFPPKLVGLLPQEYGAERVARKGLERLRWELERYEPFALSVYNGRTPEVKSVNAPGRIPAARLEAGELEQTCILTGGDPFSPGARVVPGALSAVGDLGTGPVPETIEGRRQALADWVASPANPLTARVIANRVWQWHFGRPLAANPNNFGVTGGKPSHPALLDWLAATLVEHGWSLRHLHRVIVTSAAYARASAHPDRAAVAERDPAGTALAAFPLRRLSAEELRDAMLTASGELNRAIGGIPNRPEIHPEVALQPRQVMGTFAAAWVPNAAPADRHRRSLYALRVRGLPDPAMEVFNQPGPDFSCERRDAATITPQVFSLFNGAASHARALALAHRALRESADDAGAVARCFALAFGREPTTAELAACLAHWREQIPRAKEATPAPRVPLEVRREAVEENTGERFTFTERLHAAADFQPDLAPADVSPRTRALADVCLVLFNSNEFTHVE
ncbi:MAG: PSD1 and planctomycete cytochrome C domain-containing protein [Opitutaceae bacterium]